MQKAKWYNLKRTSGSSAEILLMGEIGWEATAQDFINQVHALENDGVTDFTIRINSYGGDVFEGMAIYNALKERNVQVIIDGLAASIAGVIAMAGKSIAIQENAFFMVHNPGTFVAGDGQTLQQAQDRLIQIKDTIVAIYAQRTGLTTGAISDMMDKETWLNAQQAKEQGFVDAIIPEQTRIQNLTGTHDRSKLQKIFTNFITPKQLGEDMNKIFAMLSRLSRKAITNEAEAESAVSQLETETTAALGDLETAQSRVTELEAENAALKEAVETFENAEQERLKAEAQAIVSQAIKENKISDAESEIWTSELINNFEGTKAILDAMQRSTPYVPGKTKNVAPPKNGPTGNYTDLAEAIRAGM